VRRYPPRLSHAFSQKNVFHLSVDGLELPYATGDTPLLDQTLTCAAAFDSFQGTMGTMSCDVPLVFDGRLELD